MYIYNDGQSLNNNSKFQNNDINVFENEKIELRLDILNYKMQNTFNNVT